MTEKKRERLKQLFPLTVRDSVTALAILSAAAAVCALLRTISTTDSHVPLIFVAAVLLISLLTQGYAYGLLASVIAVFGVNYVFTYPYFQLNFSMTGYPLTFIVSFAVSVITCTLTGRARRGEALRMEAEREKMHANLLRAVSHDFRTPLTGIIGSINVVLEDSGVLPESEKRALLAQAKADAEWLINMVENLLSITRIGSGTPAALHREDQALEEVVAEAVGKFRRRYPQPELEVSVPEELLLAPVDAMLIEQVIINLLNNAVIHGRTVTKITLSVSREGERARFQVRDDGAGIAREALPGLFDGQGGRAGALREDDSRNMGIGLSVCSAIIKAHGGSMFAENPPEGGACVGFLLPLSRGGAPEELGEDGE